MRKEKRMKKGFTLLELIIVIIIVGILATIGFSQYVKVVERGRTSEAKTVLGQLRTAETGYQLQYGNYSDDVADLAIEAPTACTTTHYFSYDVDDAAGTATATRCQAGGKTPQGGTAYTLTVTFVNGTFDGTAGYY
jgi:prepilin-type N-terminal cleavage/methylation domain-containing protein